MPVKISEFSVAPLRETSQYVRPYRLTYIQDGKKRFWDGVLSHDSVSVLLYHKEKKCLLLVKQFRPVVYYSKIRERLGETGLESGKVFTVDSSSIPSSSGEALELCAGLIDGVDTNAANVAVQEVLEECGYHIDATSLRLIDHFHSSLGLIGSHMTMFYAEVDESQRVASGGGLHEEGEVIEVIEWPVSILDKLLQPNAHRPNVSPSMLYALCWFKMNILPSLPS